VFTQFYNQGNVGIGHSWSGGGAHDLADALHARDQKTGWFSTDISKLDQSLMAPMLTLLFSLPLAFYNPADAEAYKIMRSFMIWAADDIAVTMVKWTGFDYRLVIGVMFSGLYGTSWGDTVYVDVVIRTLLYHVEDFLVEGEHTFELAEFLAHDKQARIYGDNILLSLPWSVLKLITQPILKEDGTMKYEYGMVQEHFAERWGMSIKISETFVHGPGEFFTVIEHIKGDDGEVVDTVIIGKPGVNYLKRFFIQIKTPRGTAVMPFRETRDYYAKSITTADHAPSRAIHLSRWAGLLVDTAGTNPAAWNFLNSLIRSFFRLEKGGHIDWDDVIARELAFNDPELTRRFTKMGLCLDSAPFGSRSAMMGKFCRPQYSKAFTNYGVPRNG